MHYLAQRNYIHRDLAARNCLLDQRMRVKVSDFGMTTQLNNTSYYRLQKEKPLPRKWMAIESLETYVFTTKTDVWSYGVLVWELWTRGAMPYENVPNSELINYLKSGQRLSKPEYCPNVVYDLCLSIWWRYPQCRSGINETLCIMKSRIQHINIYSESLLKI